MSLSQIITTSENDVYIASNTLIIDENGLTKISDISNFNTTSYLKNVYGFNGIDNEIQTYCTKNKKIIKITLSFGYTLECSQSNNIWNGIKWIQAKNLNINDLLPIQYGQNVWGDGLDISDFKPRKRCKYKYSIAKNDINDDLFYLLGLIQGDGCYGERSVTVANIDIEIIEFLHKSKFKSHGKRKKTHHTLSSTEFCDFLKYLGFKKGSKFKTFPKKLFQCTKNQMRAFLQGLFDADGTSNSNKTKRGNIKLVSTCYELIQEIQIILLNFGITSSITKEEKPPTKKVKVSSIIYNLEIGGYFAYIFYQEIGFRLTRKQKHVEFIVDRCKDESGNIYPIDSNKLKDYLLPKNIISNSKRISRRLIKFLYNRKPHTYLEELLKEKLFYSPIKNIEIHDQEVSCFTITKKYSFFANGFILQI